MACIRCVLPRPAPPYTNNGLNWVAGACETEFAAEVFSGFLAEVYPISLTEDLACSLAEDVFGFACVHVLGRTGDLFLS